MPSAQLTLLLQEVRPSGDAGELLEQLAHALATTLLDRKLWTFPVEVTGKGKSQAKSLSEIGPVVAEIVAKAKAGAVAAGPDQQSIQAEIYQRDSGLTIFCKLSVGSDASRDALGELMHLGEALWRSCRKNASIGPGFAIRPLHIDYPRPLPPRNGYVWRPGDAAYFIDRKFHQEEAGGDPENAARLTEAPLPAGVTRHERDGLVIIACDGPAEEPSVLAEQLGTLEHWIGEVLSLPVAAGFTADGDRLINVAQKEETPPFTFYDPATATGYQALASNGNAPLDESELKEAARVAEVKKLSQGEEVKRIVFVFPDREAALRNRAALIERGATTTAYIDEQGDLWEPDPAGNWLANKASGT